MRFHATIAAVLIAVALVVSWGLLYPSPLAADEEAQVKCDISKCTGQCSGKCQHKGDKSTCDHGQLKECEKNCVYAFCKQVGSGTCPAKIAQVKCSSQGKDKGQVRIKVLVEEDEPDLGFQVQDLSPGLREALGLGGTTGVLVTEVETDSPAAEAGLRSGDVIIRIDGRRARDVQRLERLLEELELGEEIVLQVVRNGDTREIEIEVPEGGMKEIIIDTEDFDIDTEDLQELMEFGKHGFMFEGDLKEEEDQGFLGVYPSDIADQMAEYFGVAESGGVLVEGVVDDSPAKEAGFRAGDVIVEIDGEGVTSQTALVETISQIEPGTEVEIVVVRRGRTVTLRPTVGQRARKAEIKKFEFPEERFHKELVIPPDIEPGMRDDVRKEIQELKKELRELKKLLEERGYKD